jgi:hypothetical protein
LGPSCARQAQFDQDDRVRQRGAHSLRPKVTAGNEAALGCCLIARISEHARQPFPNDAAPVEYGPVISHDHFT